MKKSFVLSLVLSSIVFGVGFVNPLPVSSRSIENGGTLSAIDAYQDGVGVIILDTVRGVDNSAMNTLVFKYGATAKSNTLTLPDQILLSGTVADKALAGAFYTDGSSCVLSGYTGSTYLNGVCQGGTASHIDGEVCVHPIYPHWTGCAWRDNICECPN